MTEITTALIQELRIKTSAGMMDCKKALTEVGGDMEKAVDLLRKKGIAKAANRSDREAKEGVIKILVKDNSAYMIQLTSETDFVSRNDNFIALADELLELLSKNPTSDINVFNNCKTKSGKSVVDVVSEFSGVIGEKIDLAKVFAKKADSSEIISSYVHSNNKIGVVLFLSKGQGHEDVAKNFCMHIAAANPLYTNISEIPETNLSKEREVLKAQIINEGKPEAMADKIVEGKLRKYYEEVCLLEQNFVMDPDQKIKDVLSKTNKDLSISSFTRFNIG